MSKRTPITDEMIASLARPSSGQQYIYDSVVPGFFVCIGKIGTSFFVERKINRDGRRKKLKIKIGPCEIWTAERARVRAMEILKDIADGHDPRDGVRRTVAGASTHHRGNPVSFRLVATFEGGHEETVANVSIGQLPHAVAICDEQFALQIDRIEIETETPREIDGGVF